ncbi:MAG: class I SAM-dependent methyltransferase [Deltaproteobacteria bacterium]|nr:class I SAM-dependent methyltransferase [Deltaproteobacteria bacterium]
MFKKQIQMPKEANIDRFNRDVATSGGYLYTRNDKFSALTANQRMSRAVLALTDIKGKRLIDVGCGDGKYSLELLAESPAEVVGVDAAQNAIRSASEKSEGRGKISFQVLSIYELSSLGACFDVAVVRGVLHHLYDVERAVGEIMSIANEVVVVEPNGYSPILKILEKVSPYHRQHEERSFSPRFLVRLFERHNGLLESSLYCGLVPVFCPEPVARFLKKLEPFLERTPGLRKMCCAQFVFKVRRRR